jgi:hypothetical protein
MEIVADAQDGSSQLAVKDAVFARSGIQLYTRQDIESWGIKPRTDKALYRVYRPAGVLAAAKDKFALVPFAKTHPPVDITPDNYRQYACGTTGGPVEVVPVEGGEIGLRGRIAFATRDAYDFYMAGNRELSAGYRHHIREVRNPEDTGYDFVMELIDSVNHMALVPQGRGGSGVRVLDMGSIQAVVKHAGGLRVKNGFLAFLGIGKAKDENFKLSSVLLESVAKAHTLDAAALEKEIAGVMSHVIALGDSEAKELLVGAVTDCYKHPVEVIAQKEKVGGKIDELYVKCRAADAEAVQRILDGDGSAGAGKDGEDGKDKGGEDGKDKGGKDTKDAVPQDYASLVDAAVQKAVAAATDSFDAKIEAIVKKQLGLDGDKKPGADSRAAGSATDGAATDGVEDASYLVRGLFGNS